MLFIKNISMKHSWIRKRWWEFRQGHSIYLIFALTFINFILITYRLLIEKVPAFTELFPDLWLFALMFISFYIPAATIIGFWHRKTQLKVETTIVQHQNPFLAKMFRTLLDVQMGNASKEEIEEFRKLLLGIEEKLDK
jgi:hypothetical protein